MLDGQLSTSIGQHMPAPASQSSSHRCPAVCMGDGQRRSSRIREVFVTPLHEGGQDRLQLAAGGSQFVLVSGPRAGLLVLDLLQHARLRKTLQTRAEDRSRCAGIRLDRIEPPHAECDFSKHEQGPLLSDHRQGFRDGAFSYHMLTITEFRF